MKPTVVSQAKMNSKDEKPKEPKEKLLFDQFKIAFKQIPELNTAVKHQYIDLGLNEWIAHDNNSDV